MELSEGFIKAIEDQGLSVLTHKYLANMIADYQAGTELPAYRAIINQLQSCGYISEILDCYNRNESNFIIEKLQFYSESLSEECSLKISSVKYVLECIIYGLGLTSKPIAPSFSKISKFNPLGHWEFNFISNKSKLLIIKADGLAITDSGTRYKWEQSDDEIKLFIANTVSYDGWFADEDTIQGNAFSFVYNRSWIWNAKRCDYSLSIKNILKGRWIIVNNQVDLEDNIIKFYENRTLCSELYNKGCWFMEDEILTIETANGYIRYTFCWNKNRIEGVATNKAGIKWNCELKKLETK